MVNATLPGWAPAAMVARRPSSTVASRVRSTTVPSVIGLRPRIDRRGVLLTSDTPLTARVSPSLLAETRGATHSRAAAAIPSAATARNRRWYGVLMLTPEYDNLSAAQGDHRRASCQSRRRRSV